MASKKKRKKVSKTLKRKIAKKSLAQFNLNSLFWSRPVKATGCRTRQDFLDREKRAQDAYVGDQVKFMFKKSEQKNVFFCNLSGKRCVLGHKQYKKWRELHGSDEGIQRNFFAFKYRKMVSLYGHAWLYLQMTPKFKELRRKLRLLMFAYNDNTDRSMEQFEKYYKKMKWVAKPMGIPVLKTVLHKNKNNFLQGVWLKGIPFVYDIFITSEPTPADQIEMDAEDILEDTSDDNPEEKEYTLEEF